MTLADVDLIKVKMLMTTGILVKFILQKSLKFEQLKTCSDQTYNLKPTKTCMSSTGTSRLT